MKLDEATRELLAVAADWMEEHGCHEFTQPAVDVLREMAHKPPVARINVLETTHIEFCDGQNSLCGEFTCRSPEITHEQDSQFGLRARYFACRLKNTVNPDSIKQ